MAENILKNLIFISHYVGMREDLVQAGGGNTSVKENSEKMFIKSSGYQLSEVSFEDGYSVVNQKLILKLFESENQDEILKLNEKDIVENAMVQGKRPSIETFLHSITGTYTIHSHPVVVCALASRIGGMQELKSLFPNAMIVYYATPGISLAKEYFRIWKCMGKETPSIVFMQNHGLLVSAESAEETISLHEAVVSTIEKYLGIDNSKYSACTQIWNVIIQSGYMANCVVVLMNDTRLSCLEHDFEFISLRLCPDCIVYCGKNILALDDNFSSDDILSFCEKFGKPSVIFYKRNFYSVAESVKKAKEIESVFSFVVEISLLNKGHKLNFLSENEQNFLLGWDAEKYRKAMR